MRVGYGRVSTQDQSIRLQRDALKEADCEKIFIEKANGTQADRPQLTKALDYLRKGDTLIVWKLDRMARSLKQLVETVGELNERGIHFRCLTQDINTRTANGRLVFGIFASLAEFERELIRERTLAGLESARREGRVGGRPRKLKQEDVEAAKAMIKETGLSVRQIAEILGVSYRTLYRALPGGRANYS